MTYDRIKANACRCEIKSRQIKPSSHLAPTEPPLEPHPHIPTEDYQEEEGEEQREEEEEDPPILPSGLVYSNRRFSIETSNLIF